jgi:radical SAM superfamily enzyme YgiQ (UPF0313 family)
VKVVLISTYELGRQPFGLASPAAWLRARGHEVCVFDLAVASLTPAAVREAGLVAFYLPMHTATRLAMKAIERVKAINPGAHLCGYGLYAPINEALLRDLGVRTILGGEFEAGLAALADDPASTPQAISLVKLQFAVPDRTGLPPLARYARLHIDGEQRVAGYVEASRGCKHQCRHCPVVPVYQGSFRIVQRDVVIEDIRRQVAAGAEHITFGDPDFFNGPTHAARLAEALGREFPGLSYDVTIKVEHLLAHRDLLPLLASTGCVLVTTAAESVDDDVLRKLDKGHTRADFVRAVTLCRQSGLALNPTFIPFTPWTTTASYRELLETIAELDLVDHVGPVQLALRLLITAGSRLLELDEIRGAIGEFDPEALAYPWKHADPEVDGLAARAFRLVQTERKTGATRRRIFCELWGLVHDRPLPENFELMPRATVPYLDEPWYC